MKLVVFMCLAVVLCAALIPTISAAAQSLEPGKIDVSKLGPQYSRV